MLPEEVSGKKERQHRMDIRTHMKELCALPGVAGYEAPLSERIAQLFAPYCRDVAVDNLLNTVGVMGQGGFKVLIAAHMDEVGLMVTSIEEDGFVGFTQMGGIDPRILPAQEVTVYGRQPLYGVIGSRPPHVLSAEERKQTLALEDLYIDLGYPYERVKDLVQVGDPISFNAPAVDLLGSRVASRALDDRMGVAVMLHAMEALQGRDLPLEAHFAATAQEEVGCRGSGVLAYGLAPDLAVVLDVTHGETPDAPKLRAFDMDKVSIGWCPVTHNGWTGALRRVAEEAGIPYTLDIQEGDSSTDVDSIVRAGRGTPCVLLEVPVRYMHTTVETMDYTVVEQAGDLLARFLLEAARLGEVEV